MTVPLNRSTSPSSRLLFSFPRLRSSLDFFFLHDVLIPNPVILFFRFCWNCSSRFPPYFSLPLPLPSSPSELLPWSFSGLAYIPRHVHFSIVLVSHVLFAVVRIRCSFLFSLRNWLLTSQLTPPVRRSPIRLLIRPYGLFRLPSPGPVFFLCLFFFFGPMASLSPFFFPTFWFCGRVNGRFFRRLFSLRWLFSLCFFFQKCCKTGQCRFFFHSWPTFPPIELDFLSHEFARGFLSFFSLLPPIPG